MAKPTTTLSLNYDQALRLIDALESVQSPLPLKVEAGKEGLADLHQHQVLLDRVRKVLNRVQP